MELLGVARYEPSHDDAPEVAFVILDAWQNRGLGTVLFQALLEAAQARGLFRFRAWVSTSSIDTPTSRSGDAMALSSS
jgi:GNAT superfamily N-acetyltransferase